MSKFKNYGLWVAVAAFIGLILQDAGVIVTPEKFQGYVDIILNILVLAGIISNPSVGKGFTDKK
jgi:uncharacterized membrane protein